MVAVLVTGLLSSCPVKDRAGLYIFGTIGVYRTALIVFGFRMSLVVGNGALRHGRR